MIAGQSDLGGSPRELSPQVTLGCVWLAVRPDLFAPGALSGQSWFTKRDESGGGNLE